MAKGNPKFAGLSDDQVKTVLEKIASQLDLAAAICRNEAQQYADHDCAYSFHALETMLCGMGALADMASGAGVVGDVPTWFCGPNFHPRTESLPGQAQGGAA